MPPLTEDVSLGFTSSLLTTLRVSRAKLDAFVEEQKARADAAAEAHAQKVAQEQAAIDTCVANLLSVQMERGMKVKDDGDEVDGGIAKRREEMRERQLAFERDIDQLQSAHAEKEKHLQELKQEEDKQRARAEEARDAKQRVEEAKRTTVDDLTRGVVNYKYLGLDFEKAQDSRLRFTFTQLDAGDPLRPFTFILNVNDEDIYEVEDCQPPLRAATLLELVDRLNDSNEFSPFVRGMRNAFSETI